MYLLSRVACHGGCLGPVETEVSSKSSRKYSRNQPLNFLFILFDFIFIAHIIFNFILHVFATWDFFIHIKKLGIFKKYNFCTLFILALRPKVFCRTFTGFPIVIKASSCIHIAIKETLTEYIKYINRNAYPQSPWFVNYVWLKCIRLLPTLKVIIN